jgi:DNA-binding CsgD family transcriptional regulator
MAECGVARLPPRLGCVSKLRLRRRRRILRHSAHYEIAVRLGIAQGEPEQAERDAHNALARAAKVEAYLLVPDALSTEDAIAYAQRGRGERKRPASGWGALTPTERDVVRLVSEGLGNSDIATRLFVSPRTVQTHHTHVYTKLGLSSRVQLAQEAARHA